MDVIRIDASHKIVGRLASRIAFLLQGKNTSQFRRNISGGQKVVVTNTDKLKFSGRKFTEKRYIRHTGIIGHIRETSAENLFRRDSREILMRAVRGMLPKNRLLKTRMKNLILYRGEENIKG